MTAFPIPSGGSGRRMVDLDDTSDCPKPAACETCGTEVDVETATIGLAIGVFCLRSCGACLDPGGRPPFKDWGEAIARVAAHCEHLGIDSDQMHAVMAAETWHDLGKPGAW